MGNSSNLQQEQKGEAGVRNQDPGNQKHEQAVEDVGRDGGYCDNQTATRVQNAKTKQKEERVIRMIPSPAHRQSRDSIQPTGVR